LEVYDSGPSVEVEQEGCKLMQGGLLSGGKGIDTSEWQRCTFFQVNGGSKFPRNLSDDTSMVQYAGVLVFTTVLALKAVLIGTWARWFSFLGNGDDYHWWRLKVISQTRTKY
jgi:hypothetical protein